MTNEQIIKQLEKLIDDREAFCISDPEHDESYIKDIDALKAAIEFLKNAAPVKHGRWLSSGMILNREKCSVCGFYSDDLQVDNYCPNCGTRMDFKDGDGT